MRTVWIILGCIVLGFLAYIIAIYTVPPNFRVRSQKGPSGWTVQVKPNFIVNSINSIRIEMGGVDLVNRQGVFTGPQTIALPPTVPSGSTVTVECDLQYDRIAPCSANIWKDITLN